MERLISLIKTVVATLTDVAFEQVIVTMWEEDNPKVVDYFLIPWNYSGLFNLEEINSMLPTGYSAKYAKKPRAEDILLANKLKVEHNLAIFISKSKFDKDSEKALGNIK